MVWIDPRTWSVGELVTATKLNEIRDSLRAIGDHWTTFTPSWSATTSPPSLGNGSLVGRYRRVGFTVDFVIELTYGSETNPGSGAWRFGVPLGSVMMSAATRFSDCMARDGSDVYTISCYSTPASPNVLFLSSLPTTVGSSDRGVSGTVPFTWSAGDTLSLRGTYEAIN